MSPRILVVPGSVRPQSHNRKLAAEASRLLALTNATVTLIDLRDYALPIYDAELEETDGPPEAALLLAQRFADQDAALFVSPEYNASVSPLLKNAIDWISRVRKVKGRPVQPFRRLVVGLASASPGRLGGLRGLVALRVVCQAVGAEILTTQLALPDAGNGFDENGRLRHEEAQLGLETLVDALLNQARALGRHLP